jgi:NAD(P)-dependent dehydrogenase (short-subunit alcohol dehydrogenase family)
VSSRKAEACRQVAAERSRTGECLALPADLSTEEPCRRLAAEVAEREDRAQVLVNNAGATWGAQLVDGPHHPVAPDWRSPAESLTASADLSDPAP